MDLLEVFRDSEDLVEFSAGTEVFSEGATGEHMYVVMKGEVDITLKGKLLATAGPGEIVGEMALINSECRSATVTARTDCQLAVIDQPSFDALLRHVPDFSVYVMNTLANRLHTAFELIG